ncbi:hypothetical protein Rsub_04784 [Raphidocelis subcapitata]|uniref:Protein root UVB sensitive/RUS domain-containing protein n=1 Tax=Raphidocelis subcapitata TaxID=307507 RepID=A0A2V0P1Z9_9CHLO|nr:hypothetical protein Rsub_04784 [Raphidocelis subcapitata]|eukprot:GBF91115.1 hypothetical protein Rsub_04784 [Raphidocelis subcapitata]
MPSFVAGPALPLPLAGAAAAAAAPLHGGAGAGAAGGDGDRLRAQQLRFRLAPRRRRPFAPLASLTSSAAAAAQNGLQLLPVTTNRGGKRQQFAWDGSRIKPVSTELLGDGYTPAARLLEHLSELQRGVAASFLPRPEDVTEDYWPWFKWRLGQRFCSAVVMNFATQSLLTAVGVGAQKALAASAAINWMLKDGISRLVRMSVATQWGDVFDSDLKRFRFGSSLVFSALLSCEFVAPFFPGSFLLLASISNVGRAVGLTTFVSTQPAFQQALCASGKMADLASKTQAQHMVMDTLALAVCSGANYLLRHQEARRRLLPLLAFPIFTLGDLVCIYYELKAVQLRTLNRERTDTLAQAWVESGQIPSFKSVAEEERLLLPARVAGNLLPMRLLPLEAVARRPAELEALLARHKRDRYLLAMQAPERLGPGAALFDRLWARYETVPHVAISLAEGATPQDVATAALHAAYLRRCVVERLEELRGQSGQSGSGDGRSGGSNGQSGGGGGGGGGGDPARQRELERQRRAAAEVGSLAPQELERCVEEAGRRARRHAKRFFGDVVSAGWQTQRLLLSPTERAGYALQ